MKLRSLIFNFFAAFSKPSISQKKNRDGEEDEYIEKMKLRGSEQDRLEAMKEWSKPENIAKRKEEFEKEAPKAIERGLLLKKQIREAQGIPLEDPPLPDPLPKEMQGQSESTIRAMLRQKDWKYDRDLKVWSKK